MFFQTCLCSRDIIKKLFTFMYIVGMAYGVSITTHRKHHLGAALGSTSFVESYVQCKVSQWIDTAKALARIALTQSHSAYSAFTHGHASKWNYLMCTIPGISDLLYIVSR